MISNTMLLCSCATSHRGSKQYMTFSCKSISYNIIITLVTFYTKLPLKSNVNFYVQVSVSFVNNTIHPK